MWSSEGGKVRVTQTMSACVRSEYRRPSTGRSAPSRRPSSASPSCMLSSIPVVNMLVTPLLSFGPFHGWCLDPHSCESTASPLPGIRAQRPVPTVAARSSPPALTGRRYSAHPTHQEPTSCQVPSSFPFSGDLPHMSLTSEPPSRLSPETGKSCSAELNVLGDMFF